MPVICLKSPTIGVSTGLLSLGRNTGFIYILKKKKGKISKINKCCYLVETKVNCFM